MLYSAVLVFKQTYINTMTSSFIVLYEELFVSTLISQCEMQINEVII